MQRGKATALLQSKMGKASGCPAREATLPGLWPQRFFLLVLGLNSGSLQTGWVSSTFRHVFTQHRLENLHILYLTLEASNGCLAFLAFPEPRGLAVFEAKLRSCLEQGPQLQEVPAQLRHLEGIASKPFCSGCLALLNFLLWVGAWVV